MFQHMPHIQDDSAEVESALTLAGLIAGCDPHDPGTTSRRPAQPRAHRGRLPATAPGWWR